ncbi:GFA family protein [Sphingomonas jatrophae]|uniref:Uncharacterized conserved protein n=1 Tax=Sphingomonas jatrophae TaxID=1166337 RepID=A0A1I6JU32_9SPHN|nr:GFA family protein [Sphingomonas jatrophae]SFR82050.1 Uncharacterized conserved protein [Sphingomonas jatrophae]
MSLPDPDAPLSGGCHCGAIRFTVRLAGGWSEARRCNCSMCAMRGAVTVTAPLAGLEITHGADRIATYRFNTGVAEHHFCPDCGIYTHHRRRSNPDEFGVNVACLDGVSPFDFAAVPVSDGAHHVSDTGVERWAGMLRFEAAAR